MNDVTRNLRPSLLERAAERWDFAPAPVLPVEDLRPATDEANDGALADGAPAGRNAADAFAPPRPMPASPASEPSPPKDQLAPGAAEEAEIRPAPRAGEGEEPVAMGSSPKPAPAFPEPVGDSRASSSALPRSPASDAQPAAARSQPRVPAVAIDRALLAEQGMLVPGAPISALAEEFRLAKRQLLATARTLAADQVLAPRSVLVCSAQPGDGKTFCAVNLALSLAAERDVEVLLVDADFGKPDVPRRLGFASEGPGLLDALGDPALDVEACIVPTDVPNLSILPAGTRSHSDTELLASERGAAVLAALAAADPRRILVFDSPPVLAASPASALAAHVGQVMLVVRADRTGEAELREAVGLLDACAHIGLLLNAVSYRPGGKRFGSYYGQEPEA